MKKSIYFIALLPPTEILEEVMAFKQEVKTRFQSKKALTSPAHITLVPPFKMTDDKSIAMRREIAAFNHTLTPFLVHLQDFSAFPPRVVFINVEPSTALSNCKKAITQHFYEKFDVETKDNFPFHPHMTIAFKDLKEAVFPDAWAYFQEQSYERYFQAEAVTLLRFREGKWYVF